jgi:hypothetical protein
LLARRRGLAQSSLSSFLVAAPHVVAAAGEYGCDRLNERFACGDASGPRSECLRLQALPSEQLRAREEGMTWSGKPVATGETASTPNRIRTGDLLRERPRQARPAVTRPDQEPPVYAGLFAPLTADVPARCERASRDVWATNGPQPTSGGPMKQVTAAVAALRRRRRNHLPAIGSPAAS